MSSFSGWPVVLGDHHDPFFRDFSQSMADKESNGLITAPVNLGFWASGVSKAIPSGVGRQGVIILWVAPGDRGPS